jgi:probable rRNA maturation factor
LSNIYFHDLKISRLKDKNLLKGFLRTIFQKEKKLYTQIDIIFCSDTYLLDLNRKFLSHNYYTDTLTFLIENKPIVGEIYISIDRVKDNSKELKISYQRELVRVIIHSCLHLCGYTDDTHTHKRKMLEKQENYLNEFFVSRET